jgi:hypothetical protein
MRASFPVLLLALLLLSTEGSAQPVTRTAPRDERGLYLTVFRSPATGVELRAGHVAAYAGFYPTVIRRDGARANVNFVRAGVTWFLKASGAGGYVSPSLLVSLDRGWPSGALTEVGFRGRLYGRVNGRLGAAVLTTFGRQVRVNPTIGLDIKLGSAR